MTIGRIDPFPGRVQVTEFEETGDSGSSPLAAAVMSTTIGGVVQEPSASQCESNRVLPFRAIGGNCLLELRCGCQSTPQLVRLLLGKPCHEPGIIERVRKPALLAYPVCDPVTVLAVGKVFESGKSSLRRARIKHPLCEPFCRRLHAVPTDDKKDDGRPFVVHFDVVVGVQTTSRRRQGVPLWFVGTGFEATHSQ